MSLRSVSINRDLCPVSMSVCMLWIRNGLSLSHTDSFASKVHLFLSFCFIPFSNRITHFTLSGQIFIRTPFFSLSIQTFSNVTKNIHWKVLCVALKTNIFFILQRSPISVVLSHTVTWYALWTETRTAMPLWIN